MLNFPLKVTPSPPLYAEAIPPPSPTLCAEVTPLPTVCSSYSTPHCVLQLLHPHPALWKEVLSAIDSSHLRDAWLLPFVESEVFSHHVGFSCLRVLSILFHVFIFVCLCTCVSGVSVCMHVYARAKVGSTLMSFCRGHPYCF